MSFFRSVLPLRRVSTALFIAERAPFQATTYSRPDIVFTKAKGVTLWDSRGKEYLDLSAGIAVTALGHCDDGVAEILADQLQTLVHTSNLFHNLWTGELSKNLVQATVASGGMAGAKQVFLCNSGTEANEAALKFARKYAKKYGDQKTEFVTFKNSFHGRTFGALSVTPNPKYQAPFAPLVPGVHVAEPNNIESVKAVVSEKTCGIIIEPIQGEGGVTAMDPAFLVQLREVASSVDALLIFDEIQCGLGRTGRLWAHGSLPPSAHPDIVTMAKALGNGFPIGATMIGDKVALALQVGDHGTTYGGNPLGSRVGNYVLGRLTEEGFLDEVAAKGAWLRQELELWVEEIPLVKEIRGEGLIAGVHFDTDPTPIVAAARDLGLVVISAGDNVVRLVPALTILQDELARGVALLKQAVESVQ